jgi:formylglycine-generating enzyme required for sulfatase activity
MHGNVWEWTADCWRAVSDAPDGSCAQRVLKGGAWNSGGWRLRAGHRIAKNETAREFDNGFRVVRELD